MLRLCFVKGIIMSNINKILVTVVACVFMVCVACVSIVGIVTSNKDDTTTTTTLPEPQQTQSTAGTSSPAQGTAQTTTKAQDNSVSGTTTTKAPTSAPSSASAAVTGDLAKDIIGKWTDSAGMSGYEFLEGGKVNMTYVDLAGFGVPFDGKASGLYTLEGDTLTVKFSIYTATIKKVYRISIKENELSMYDLEDFEASTYARVTQ